LVLTEEQPQQPDILPLTPLRLAPISPPVSPVPELGGELLQAVFNATERISRAAPHLNEILASFAATLQNAIPPPSPAATPEQSGQSSHCGERNHAWVWQHRQRVRELANEALVLMDAKDYTAAKEKFLEQLSIIKRPWHRSSPLYNIACCESLLGNFESALLYLEQAISAGFRDVEHMRADTDLDNIRNLEKFGALMEKASSEQPQVYTGRCCSRGRQEWFELQQQALALMDSQDPESLKLARELLEKQLLLSPNPWGQRIPLYNIACCEALRGNTDEALSFLQAAVNAGYRNLRHIEGDADLDSLRNLEAYQQILASIKSGHRKGGKCGQNEPEQSEEKPAESQFEPEPEVAQPEPVVEPEPEPVAEQPSEAFHYFTIPQDFEHFRTQLEVLAQMGFVELNQNLQALASAQGDIAQTIERLLQ